METLIIQLHDSTNETIFITISAIIGVIFCLWLIPKTTDLMTDSAAGLAGKYWGRDQRTLVINSSTNNPELFLMLLSLSIGRLGGIATPLGSNFANIYLMFMVAPLIVIGKWLFLGKIQSIKDLIELVSKEKMVFVWHFVMSLLMFVFATLAYWLITGKSEFLPLADATNPRSLPWLLLGNILCLAGIGVFFIFEGKFKEKRPELFEEITEEEGEASWLKLVLGTAGLIGLCYVLNTFFVAWTVIYTGTLSNFFGTAIFAGLHYFLGSLISSLPETAVAVKNYERLTPADLNTAMASASQSNMTNLAIGCLGSLLAGGLLLAGFNYQL